MPGTGAAAALKAAMDEQDTATSVERENDEDIETRIITDGAKVKVCFGMLEKIGGRECC
jgi:hypothetical protein